MATENAAFDFEALKAQHGDKHVLKVNTALGPVVLRTANEGSADRFLIGWMDSDPAKKVNAVQQLGRDCVIYPSKEEFRSMCREKPGIAVLIGRKAQELLGIDEVAEGKE